MAFTGFFPNPRGSQLTSRSPSQQAGDVQPLYGTLPGMENLPGSEPTMWNPGLVATRNLQARPAPMQQYVNQILAILSHPLIREIFGLRAPGPTQEPRFTAEPTPSIAPTTFPAPQQPPTAEEILRQLGIDPRTLKEKGTPKTPTTKEKKPKQQPVRVRGGRSRNAVR